MESRVLNLSAHFQLRLQHVCGSTFFTHALLLERSQKPDKATMTQSEQLCFSTPTSQHEGKQDHPAGQTLQVQPKYSMETLWQVWSAGVIPGWVRRPRGRERAPREMWQVEPVWETWIMFSSWRVCMVSQPLISDLPPPNVGILRDGTLQSTHKCLKLGNVMHA